MKDTKIKSICFIVLLIAVTSLFLATRFYRLDVVPFGAHRMHIDELGAAYDAFCISEYGVDQFLLKMPPYFRCFGEGQNALYTYLSAIVFKIAGISLFNYRLSAVICAMGAFAALFFLMKEMLDKWYALVALALMTIMPVFMISEHWGLEAYLLMSFVIISMCFHVHAAMTGSSLHYFLAGVFWGLSYYTYSLSYIVVTVFLILSMAILMKYKKITLKNALLAGIPVLVLGFPLLMEQLVMMGALEPFSLFGVMDLWVPPYTRYHGISWEYVSENLLGALRFIYVDDNDAYNSNRTFGTMYYVSIPFILIGMVASAITVIKDIKRKVLNPWLFCWLFYLCSRIFLLFVKEPNVNRINGIYPEYLMFTVYGIKTALEKFKFKKALFTAGCVAYIIPFVLFSKYMYSHDGLQNDAYDIGDSLGCDIQAAETAALAKKLAMGRPVYALLNDGWMRHLSMALYTETSPYDFFRDNEPQDRSFNGVEWEMPDGLDLTGDTVYLIDNELSHITQYLISEGFAADMTYPDYTVVYRPVQ